MSFCLYITKSRHCSISSFQYVSTFHSISISLCFVISPCLVILMSLISFLSLHFTASRHSVLSPSHYVSSFQYVIISLFLVILICLVIVLSRHFFKSSFHNVASCHSVSISQSRISKSMYRYFNVSRHFLQSWRISKRAQPTTNQLWQNPCITPTRPEIDRRASPHQLPLGERVPLTPRASSWRWILQRWCCILWCMSRCRIWCFGRLWRRLIRSMPRGLRRVSHNTSACRCLRMAALPW